MKKLKQKITTSSEFFSYRYPSFSDTFEIHDPFLTTHEELIVQRALALIRQGKSMAIYGEPEPVNLCSLKLLPMNWTAKVTE